MPKVVDIYVFERKIGQGQFGEVFKGFNRDTLEDVAIKTVNRQNLTGKFLELLENEVKVLRSCENPNIIKLYDIKKTQNNIYLILEYCNEGDLMKYMQTRKRLTEDEAVEFFIQIINGFKTLVRAKIMHRDFKLANILLHNGTIKIADFGFAKLLGKEDMASTMLGSPLNMAPEVLQSLPYNNKADIWSVGCCFYELLFGKPPFISNNIPNLIRTIKTTALVIPKKVNPISAVVEDALRKMLVVDSESRIEWEDLFRHPVLFYKEEKIKKELENSLRSEIDKTLQMSKFYLRNNIIWNHPNDVAKRNDLNTLAFDLVLNSASENPNTQNKILRRNKPSSPKTLTASQGFSEMPTTNNNVDNVGAIGEAGIVKEEENESHTEESLLVKKIKGSGRLGMQKKEVGLTIDVLADNLNPNQQLTIPLPSPLSKTDSPSKILKRSLKPSTPKRSGLIPLPSFNESKTFSENSEEESSPRSLGLQKMLSKPKSPRKSQFSSVLEPERFGFGASMERAISKEASKEITAGNEGPTAPMEESINISPTKILKRNKVSSPRKSNLISFGAAFEDDNPAENQEKVEKSGQTDAVHDSFPGETQKETQTREIKYCGRRLLHERNKYVFLASVADELMTMKELAGADVVAFLLIKKMLGLFETLIERLNRRENVFNVKKWEDFLHCKEFYLVYDEISKGFEIFKGLYSHLLVLAMNQVRTLDPQKNLAYDEDIASVLNHNYSQKFEELFRRVISTFAKNIFLMLFQIKEQSQEEEEAIRSLWIIFEKILDAAKLDQAFQFENLEKEQFVFNDYYERGQKDELSELMARTLSKYKTLEL